MNPAVRRGATPRLSDGLPRFVAGSVAMGWRWLRRMRTALYLLGVLAFESLLATWIPQEPNVPTTVAAWRDGIEGPGDFVSDVLIDPLGLYDVYGSPAFQLLLLLLFVSLTACLLPRFRAWYRLVRFSRPPRSRNLAGHPEQAQLVTALDVDRAETVLRDALVSRRWRLRDPEPPVPAELPADDAAPPSTAPPRQIAAEKGHGVREGGSLAFHVSFYVLIGAVIVGQLVGFSGQVGVSEGEAFADTRIAYFSYDPGRWWEPQDHAGFTLELDEFTVEWDRAPSDEAFAALQSDPSSAAFERWLRLIGAPTPTKFEAEFVITTADGETYSEPAAPNDPITIDGQKVHVLDWGYAPRIIVEVDGRVVHDGVVQLRNSAELGAFNGVVKGPAAEPEVALEMLLSPFAPEGPDGGPLVTRAPWADAPLLQYVQLRGDLRLDVPQRVDELIPDGLVLDGSGAIRLGESATSGGVTVTFAELGQWVGLQVSNRPTVGWMLLGSGLMLGGLIPALYAYRRRLWIDLVALPDGATSVRVAGRPFQRPERFEAEFADLVADLADAVDARDGQGPAVGGVTDPASLQGSGASGSTAPSTST